MTPEAARLEHTAMSVALVQRAMGLPSPAAEAQRAAVMRDYLAGESPEEFVARERAAERADATAEAFKEAMRVTPPIDERPMPDWETHIRRAVEEEYPVVRQAATGVDRTSVERWTERDWPPFVALEVAGCDVPQEVEVFTRDWTMRLRRIDFYRHGGELWALYGAEVSE